MFLLCYNYVNRTGSKGRKNIMNNIAEIVRISIISGLGVVLMVMAFLMANGNSFLTKGMNKKYTNESVKDYCKSNFLGQIIFSLGLILEGIFSKGIFYYLGVGCLFFGAVLMVAVSKKLVKRV